MRSAKDRRQHAATENAVRFISGASYVINPADASVRLHLHRTFPGCRGWVSGMDCALFRLARDYVDRVFRPCIDLHEGRVKQIVGGSFRRTAVI